MELRSVSRLVFLAAFAASSAVRAGAQCPGPGGQVESEPNGSAATADPIAFFSFEGYFVGVRGAIDTPGDVDYYSVQVTAPGSRLWLVVDTGVPQAAGSSRDSVVAVLAPDGATVLEQDDDDGTGNGRDATIESLDASVIGGLQLGAAATYYVRVQGKNPGDAISRYVLAIGRTNFGSQPEQEPNDDPSFAFPPAMITDGTISSPTDQDWYLTAVLDNGIPLIVVDGDPERDGTTTDVTLRYVDFFSGATMDTDSAVGAGAPAPAAEGFVHDALGRLRVMGASAGTYRMAVLYSGDGCAVPVELQSFEAR